MERRVTLLFNTGAGRKLYCQKPRQDNTPFCAS